MACRSITDGSRNAYAFRTAEISPNELFALRAAVPTMRCTHVLGRPSPLPALRPGALLHSARKGRASRRAGVLALPRPAAVSGLRVGHARGVRRLGRDDGEGAPHDASAS